MIVHTHVHKTPEGLSNPKSCIAIPVTAHTYVHVHICTYVNPATELHIDA